MLDQLLEEYYAQNGKKLRKIVDGILAKFGGIYQKDYDDFYSAANETFVNAQRTFEESKGKSFEAYFYSCLLFTVMDEITKRNRDKRKNKIEVVNRDGLKEKIYIDDISIETSYGEDERILSETIPSSFDMDYELSEQYGIHFNERVQKYLNSLSKTQRKIVEMRINAVPVYDIKEKLELTDNLYSKHMKSLRMYEKTKLLYREETITIEKVEEEESIMEMSNRIGERTKNTSYSINAIIKKLHNYTLRDDHILQRSSGQWHIATKSELISDVLQGRSLLPIIVSEEKRNDVIFKWLIDGLQRCSAFDEFKNDGFVIYKNVRLHKIVYQTTELDCTGRIVLDKNNNPVYTKKVYDIRGKKYSDLPDELKDKFNEYQMPVMLNLDSTKKEIAYDIARFNRCRPMTKSQLGFLNLEEGLGEIVNQILQMPFFHDETRSNYKQSDFKSSNMKRMIVESVMITNFLEDWNKSIEKVCEYLSENACEAYFIDLYDVIERLTNISNEDIADMFNSKDSFIWFALFDKFSNLELEDNKFAEFMSAFKGMLHNKEVNGITYEKLNERSNKDKATINNKMKLLQKLMYEYLQIQRDISDDLESQETDILKLIQKEVNPAITEEDIALYFDALSDWTVNVDNKSNLLNEKNKPSLIALVGYAWHKEIDLEDWIVDYFKRNHTYIKNQRENYILMKIDLEAYIAKEVKNKV